MTRRSAPNHLVIPDTQCRKGVPLDHLRWIGEYIVDRRPDTIIHLGDHWDMPSLSQHDQAGSLRMEGARYEDDIEAGNEGFEMICKPMERLKAYKPRRVFLRGNHEHRVERAINAQPKYAGTIGYHHMNTRGWEVIDFLKPIVIDGVAYSHYFPNPYTGKPWGGSVQNILGKICQSFTQGHKQGKLQDERFHQITGRQMRGMICGSAYLHDEDYKGPQGNHHWRGVLVKHAVSNGGYNLMEVDMEFLCAKYENMTVARFLQRKYRNAKERFSLAA
jgi:hypothetical protein